MRENDDFVSNICVRPTKDEKYKMILNLKTVNSYMVYHHFKMDILLSAMTMMRPNYFMALFDSIDAYYSVPIYPENILNFNGILNITNRHIFQMSYAPVQENLLN